MSKRRVPWLLAALGLAALGLAAWACAGGGDAPKSSAASAGSTSTQAPTDAATAPFVGSWKVASGEAKSSCDANKSLAGTAIEVSHAGPGLVSFPASDCEVKLAVSGQQATAKESVTCSKEKPGGSSTIVYDTAIMKLEGRGASMTWKFTMSGKAGGTAFSCQFDAVLTLERQ